MPSRPNDPMLSFCFKVVINGAAAGYFKSVSGLDSETEVAGARTKWGNITLKRGYITSDPLAHKVSPGMLKAAPGAGMLKANPASAMHKVNPGDLQLKAAGRLVLHGFVLDERNGHLLRHWVTPGGPSTSTPLGQIVMVDPSGAPVRQYNFYEAWPCKWYVPEYDGSQSVELVVSRLTRT